MLNKLSSTFLFDKHITLKTWICFSLGSFLYVHTFIKSVQFSPWVLFKSHLLTLLNKPFWIYVRILSVSIVDFHLLYFGFNESVFNIFFSCYVSCHISSFSDIALISGTAILFLSLYGFIIFGISELNMLALLNYTI